MDPRPLAAALDEAAQAGVFPGAVLRVSRAGELLFEHAAGRRAAAPASPPMHSGVAFDLSSLTKPLATAVAFFQLVAEGRADLDRPVARDLPGFAAAGKGGIAPRHLLAHCSGLAAHREFWREVLGVERDGRPGFAASAAARHWMFERVDRESLESAPGTRAVYSDLGFIALGRLVEELAGEPLDRACARRTFAPLGLDSLFFIDLARPGAAPPAGIDVAPTGFSPARGRVADGEVDDDNAWAMGGVAGHAGLFGSAAAVDRLATALEACARGGDGPLPPAAVAAMWRRDPLPGSTRTLGWDTPTPGRSSSGRHLSPRSVGHLGFTGTSLWMDLERRLNVVLLSNRVHPSRENDKLAAFRPRIHDLVLEAL